MTENNNNTPPRTDELLKEIVMQEKQWKDDGMMAYINQACGTTFGVEDNKNEE